MRPTARIGRAVAGGTSARSCDNRHAERGVDLHPGTGQRIGRAAECGSRWSASATFLFRSKPPGWTAARPGLPPNRLSPGLDAGWRSRTSRTLPAYLTALVEELKPDLLHLNQLVLRQPSGGNSPLGRRPRRFDQLVESGPWTRARREPLAALVSRGGDAGSAAGQHGGRAFGVDAGYDSLLLRPAAARCGDLQRPQSVCLLILT